MIIYEFLHKGKRKELSSGRIGTQASYRLTKEKESNEETEQLTLKIYGKGSLWPVLTKENLRINETINKIDFNEEKITSIPMNFGIDVIDYNTEIMNFPKILENFGNNALGLEEQYYWDTMAQTWKHSGTNEVVQKANSDFFNENKIYQYDGALYLHTCLLKVSNDYINYQNDDGKVRGTIKILAGTTCIVSRAFFDCTNLMDIEIPSSVKYIGKNAFYNCSRLDRLFLGDTIVADEIIIDKAFVNCSSLIYIKNNYGNSSSELLKIMSSDYYCCIEDSESNKKYYKKSIKELELEVRVLGESYETGFYQSAGLIYYLKFNGEWDGKNNYAYILGYVGDKNENVDIPSEIVIKSGGIIPQDLTYKVIVDYTNVNDKELRVRPMGLRKIRIVEPSTDEGRFTFYGLYNLSEVTIATPKGIHGASFTYCQIQKFDIDENCKEYYKYLADGNTKCLFKKINNGQEYLLVYCQTSEESFYPYDFCYSRLTNAEKANAIVSIGSTCLQGLVNIYELNLSNISTLHDNVLQTRIHTIICDTLLTPNLNDGTLTQKDTLLSLVRENNNLVLLKADAYRSTNDINEFCSYFYKCIFNNGVQKYKDGYSEDDYGIVRRKSDQNIVAYIKDKFLTISSLAQVIIDQLRGSVENLTIEMNDDSSNDQLISLRNSVNIKKMTIKSTNENLELKFNCYNNKQLRKIIFEINNIKSIQFFDMRYNPQIYSFTFPEKTNIINRISDSNIFNGCSRLHTIDYSKINNNEINFYSPMNISSTLTEIYYPKLTIQAYIPIAVSPSSIEYIYLKNGSTKILSSAFLNSNLKEINLPQTIEKIGTSVFKNCKNLNNIILPMKLKEIPEYTFQDSGIQEIQIPYGVTTIQTQAFNNCKDLTKIIIPSSMKTIYKESFKDCNKLQEITIPNSVKSIGDFAFFGCTGFTSVIIPDSVTSIGDYALGYYYNSDTDGNSLIDGFTIYGYAESAAETYANNNDINFVPLSE